MNFEFNVAHYTIHYTFVSMRAFIILILICVSFSKSHSQNIRSQDSLVNQLVVRHKALNAQKMTMQGYRIQLYFGGDRLRAVNMRLDFLQQYPDIGAYVIYQQPNFKLRIGDFKTRIETMAFLNEMQPGYSMAFIVADDVKLPVIE